jgi:hypothetical protein
MPDDFGDTDFSDSASEAVGDSSPGAVWDSLHAEQPAPEQAHPSLEPPVSWPAERKARWSTLSREDQEFFATREREAHSKITTQGQELAQLRQEYERLASFDVDAHVASIKSKLEQHEAEIARRDNQALFEKFMKGRDYLQDPQVQLALANEMKEILAQVPQLKGEHLLHLAHARLEERLNLPAHLEQQRTAARRTEQQKLEQEQQRQQEQQQQFEQWHRQELERHIESRDRQWSQLLQRERASWALKAQETEQQRQVAAEEHAKRARRAAAVNVKSSPGHSRNLRSIDDDLRSIAARVYGS